MTGLRRGELLALRRRNVSLRDTGAEVDHWRGVREPERCVCRVGSSSDVRTATAAAGLDGLAVRSFDQIGAWREASYQQATVANFVIREVVPDARDDILAQLLDQANTEDGALSRPGCLGLSLASEVDASHTMLGITYWTTIDDFDEYATWASTAPWKDVITPVTVDAPLRLLTRRHETGD